MKASIKQSHKTIRHITGPVPHKLTKAYTFDYGNVNFAEYVSLVLLSTAQYNQWGLNRQLINQSINTLCFKMGARDSSDDPVALYNIKLKI